MRCVADSGFKQLSVGKWHSHGLTFFIILLKGISEHGVWRERNTGHTLKKGAYARNVCF